MRINSTANKFPVNWERQEKKIVLALTKASRKQKTKSFKEANKTGEENSFDFEKGFKQPLRVPPWAYIQHRDIIGDFGIATSRYFAVFRCRHLALLALRVCLADRQQERAT